MRIRRCPQRRHPRRAGSAVIVVLSLLAAACADERGELRFADPPVDDPTTTQEATAPAVPELTTTARPSDATTEPEAPLIRVDQFGYRPGDPKVAVIADPQVGYDADRSFEPAGSFQLRRWSDHEVVLEAPATAWADGTTQGQSGDRGWWFDFSEVEEPGSYYVIDPASGEATGRFEIAADVYDDVLDAALRMFWYNRANTAHPESLSGAWSDDAAYIGPGQDTEARSVDNPTDPATARDLSGGWFDAGDTNKYVTFAVEPVHQLLAAYRRAPDVFDDAVGIPESSNGIADIVDEVRWEISWLARMQQEGGGVLTKVGLTDSGEPSVPSRSTLPRYYEEACSSSTIAAAGMFAHAAVVFASIPALADEATRLTTRARSAWDWYQASEKRDDCDPQVVRAGDADLSLEEQRNSEVVAAVYLYALTQDSAYDAVVRAGHSQTLPFVDDGFGRYGPDQSEALLYYRDLATAHAPTVQAIDGRIAELVAGSPTHGFDPAADLYRASMADDQYHWGSNMVTANTGSANLAVEGGAAGRERALGHLNYLHGVNPFAMVYLTNMGELGAERSAQTLFHFWFGESTAYDVDAGSDVGVAPGFLVGGPNRGYSGSASPPGGQPTMKSYRDWSSYGSEPSWEVGEPAIYYQAAYVRLLSAVLSS